MARHLSRILVLLFLPAVAARGGKPPAKPYPDTCDSLPARPCIPLWPGAAPNETDVPKTPPERRAPDDGQGCGPGRNIPCDHIFDVRPFPPSHSMPCHAVYAECHSSR